jgi:DNA-binding NtrC family response regulator
MANAIASARQVLLVVEDAQLAELLRDALADAGHACEVAASAELRTALRERRFDAAIVDLDSRARDGAELVGLLRAEAPHTTVIALLPCGGLLPAQPRIAYHLAIEKPARLQTLLAALAAAPVRG